MIGAIIGDVVGSRFEFNNIKTKKFDLITDESNFTDDTVLTIAVMDILCHTENWDQETLSKFLQKWARKYPNAGYGSMFYSWIRELKPKPYNSCGNGSAMRISAAGWFAKSEEEVIELSKAITEITHNHPEGIKGAEVTAMCIYKALHGETKDQIRMYVEEKYPSIKKLNYDDLVKTYVHGEEICQNTVPQAIYCFLISNDFEDCLRTTISIGGDCDTTAAISCAIAEAYYQEIPKELENKVREKLPTEMLEIISDAEFISNMM